MPWDAESAERFEKLCWATHLAWTSRVFVTDLVFSEIAFNEARALKVQFDKRILSPCLVNVRDDSPSLFAKASLMHVLSGLIAMMTLVCLITLLKLR